MRLVGFFAEASLSRTTGQYASFRSGSAGVGGVRAATTFIPFPNQDCIANCADRCVAQFPNNQQQAQNCFNRCRKQCPHILLPDPSDF